MTEFEEARNIGHLACRLHPGIVENGHYTCCNESRLAPGCVASDHIDHQLPLDDEQERHRALKDWSILSMPFEHIETHRIPVPLSICSYVFDGQKPYRGSRAHVDIQLPLMGCVEVDLEDVRLTCLHTARLQRRQQQQQTMMTTAGRMQVIRVDEDWPPHAAAMTMTTAAEQKARTDEAIYNRLGRGRNVKSGFRFILIRRIDVSTLIL